MLQVLVVVCVCREVISSAILSRFHIHVTSTNLKQHFLVRILSNYQLTLTDEQLHTFTGPQVWRHTHLKGEEVVLGANLRLSDLSKAERLGVSSLDPPPLDHINPSDYMLNTQMTPFAHTFTFTRQIVHIQSEHFLLWSPETNTRKTDKKVVNCLCSSFFPDLLHLCIHANQNAHTKQLLKWWETYQHNLHSTSILKTPGKTAAIF